ncbi:hypothetical protein LY13_000902 [Prauserella aidingensis]|uniref:MerR n=1 Tax=Prauserella aidingensis TaxID=387890 RepID=UPI0020A562E0|nr:MerR [Prauserella aidingensis]MCP2252163.1 hypothetical protein [Prauserella aidingensis]
MTNERTYYDVVVTREDGLWVAVVDGLPGGATDVDRMRDLESDVRDLIAGLRDLDPEDFEIRWHYRQGEHDLTPAVALLQEREQSAEEAVRKRDEARYSAIVEMHEAGLSYRTIADLVGISHQRVQQLASAGTSA